MSSESCGAFSRGHVKTEMQKTHPLKRLATDVHRSLGLIPICLNGSSVSTSTHRCPRCVERIAEAVYMCSISAGGGKVVSQSDGRACANLVWQALVHQLNRRNNQTSMGMVSASLANRCCFHCGGFAAKWLCNLAYFATVFDSCMMELPC